MDVRHFGFSSLLSAGQDLTLGGLAFFSSQGTNPSQGSPSGSCPKHIRVKFWAKLKEGRMLRQEILLVP